MPGEPMIEARARRSFASGSNGRVNERSVELAMLVAIARIVAGATLGALFLLIMACATAVDFIETSRAARRAAETSRGLADELSPRSDQVLT